MISIESSNLKGRKISTCLPFLQKVHIVFKQMDTSSQWIIDLNCTCIRRSTLGSNNVVIYKADQHTPNLPICSPGQYECKDKSCILDIYVCDGVMDCSRNEDESHCLCCMITNIYCTSLYKQLPSSGCVSHHKFNSQYITNNISGKDNMYQRIMNDFYPDIISGTDGEEYKLLLSLKIVNSPSKCKNGEIPCFPGHSKCFKLRHTCLYDLDGHGQGHILFC